MLHISHAKKRVILCAVVVVGYVLSFPPLSTAGTAKRLITVPDMCSRVESIDEDTVYLSSGKGACLQVVSRMQIDLDPDIKTVRVYVDGKPWVKPGADEGDNRQDVRDIAKIDIDVINDINQAAASMKNQIVIPKNPHQEAAEKKAREFFDFYNSPEFQAKLEAEKKRQLNETLAEAKSYYPDAFEKIEQRKEFMADTSPGNERVYILISSSVPESVVRTYIAAADRLSGSVPVILRGFIGGISKAMPTLKYIQRLSKKDQNCDPMKSRCEFYSAPVLIDPLIFGMHNVEAVPAFVYVGGLKVSDAEMSEGNEDNVSFEVSHVVYGDVSLEFALSEIQREVKSPYLEQMLAKVRGEY